MKRQKQDAKSTHSRGKKGLSNLEKELLELGSIEEEAPKDIIRGRIYPSPKK